jgi:negative regulator of flagellin synthesis FlgM
LLDAKRAERTSSASQTEASRASDTVTLTDAAKKAAGATKIATENSGVDLDKVERIKRAIAEGKYPLDPDAIADKMVSLNSLLTPPPGIQR